MVALSLSSKQQKRKRKWINIYTFVNFNFDLIIWKLSLQRMYCLRQGLRLRERREGNKKWDLLKHAWFVHVGQLYVEEWVIIITGWFLINLTGFHRAAAAAWTRWTWRVRVRLCIKYKKTDCLKSTWKLLGCTVFFISFLTISFVAL